MLAASATPQPRNELTCQICMDIMTDLDNFITSESTEQEIIDFVKQVKQFNFGKILFNLLI